MMNQMNNKKKSDAFSKTTEVFKTSKIWFFVLISASTHKNVLSVIDLDEEQSNQSCVNKRKFNETALCKHCTIVFLLF